VWQNSERTGKRGHPRTYSDTAIATMATLQEVYHLGVRQAEGLLQSIGELLSLEVAIPDYSTLSRRRATLEVVLPRTRSKEALHVVVDSTGVKVFGEGEWKVRQHGYTYRRTWRKVHLGVDEASGELVAAVVTTNNYSDSQILPGWGRWRRRLRRYRAMGAMTGGTVTRPLGHDRRKPPSRRSTTPRSGSMATPRPSAWPGTRICAAFARSDAQPGNGSVGIIAGVWPRPPCFGSRRFLVSGSRRTGSQDKRRRCWYAVRH
jgi:IS5 family transposase